LKHLYPCTPPPHQEELHQVLTGINTFVVILKLEIIHQIFTLICVKVEFEDEEIHFRTIVSQLFIVQELEVKA
jgi:hypothetical protein